MQEKMTEGYAAWSEEKLARSDCVAELLKNFSVHYGNETAALIESVPDEILHMIHPHWYQFPAPSQSWNIGFAVVYILLGTFAFLGNSLVLVLFARRHATRTGIDVLTANLALADLLMACTQFPILVVNSFSGKWTLGPIVCKVYGFCGALCGTVSIVTMALIALDRYYAIVHPFSGMSFSSSRGYRWAIHSWVYAISWCIPPFWGWNSYVPEGFMTHCGFDFISSDCWSRAYVILLCLAAYFIPLLVIVFCYVYIVLHVLEHETDLRSQAKKMNMDSTNAMHNTRYHQEELKNRQKASAELSDIVTIKNKSVTTIGSFRKEQELAKVAFTIISLWLFAWTPYTVISIMGIMSLHSYLTPLGTMIPALCAKTASLYNPIVYALMHPKYKQELYYLCPKLMPKRLHHQASTMSSRSYVSRTTSNDYDRKSVASRTASCDTTYGPRSPAIRSLRGTDATKTQYPFPDPKSIRTEVIQDNQPQAVSEGAPKLAVVVQLVGTAPVTSAAPTLQRKPVIYRKPKGAALSPILLPPPFVSTKSQGGGRDSKSEEGSQSDIYSCKSFGSNASGSADSANSNCSLGLR